MNGFLLIPSFRKECAYVFTDSNPAQEFWVPLSLVRNRILICDETQTLVNDKEPSKPKIANQDPAQTTLQEESRNPTMTLTGNWDKEPKITRIENDQFQNLCSVDEETGLAPTRFYNSGNTYYMESI